MKKSRFSEQQIAFVLRQAEEGTAVAEVCRKAGISDASFYNWRKKYGGLMPSEMRRLKQLDEEPQRLGLAIDHCLGAIGGVGPVVASMIWPPIARNSAAASAASKRLNRTSMAGLPRSLARVSASQKVQIVFASGTVLASPSPRKRMNSPHSAKPRLEVRIPYQAGFADLAGRTAKLPP